MICISEHNIMLLATLLLRIYPNYVLHRMYEIGDYVIVLTLFYHSSYPSLYVNFVSYGNIVCRHICLLIFPSITNCIMYLKMYANEMQQVIEIKFFLFFFSWSQKTELQ